MFGTGRAVLTTKLESGCMQGQCSTVSAVYCLFHCLHMQSNDYLNG
jgi:hypothetical protein